MKLLAVQYEVLTNVVRDAVKSRFTRNATHEEIMDIRDEIINEIPNLKENLVRLKSLSDRIDEITAEYENIFKHVKNNIEEHSDSGYHYFSDKHNYVEVDDAISEIAKNIARKRHLIKKLTTACDRMISNKIYMFPTRNKEMDEISRDVTAEIFREIESNPDKYVD